MSHSNKANFICQEIFAKIAMYNFCQMITQLVAIFKKRKKYTPARSLYAIRPKRNQSTYCRNLAYEIYLSFLTGKNGLS